MAATKTSLALLPRATVNAHQVKTVPRPHGRPYSAEGAEEVGQERWNKSLSTLDVGLVIDGAIGCENEW